MQSTQPQAGKTFGKFRNFLWPIHGYEHRKLIPMLFLFFLISFVYNLLRWMKITLVVTAEGSGAEVIPFLKVWAVLPAAVLITYLYTKLSNRLSREQVFCTMIGIFLGFFTLFLLVLHPNREILELSQLSNFLQIYLPEGLKGLIFVIRHWSLSLFYVTAEMWSAIMLSMLFWGFANEVTSVDEAKRFYAIFALAANFSGIFSGESAQLLTVHQYNPRIPFGTTAWDQTLGLQLGSVLLIGLIIVILFRYVSRSATKRKTANFASYQLSISKNESSVHKAGDFEEEKKLSLLECFSYIIKSPYMVYIAILVVAYNVVHNLADVMWTYQVHQRFPDANDFNAYTNRIGIVIGIFSTLSGFILSGNVIRRYGWTATALITPIIWLITSIVFFGCMLFEVNPVISDSMFAFFNIPVTSLILFFGSAQICLGRAAKYTVFDETKEIAFIPLSKSEQRKGKAVVDGIGSRFGKSGGSLAIQVLLVLCSDLVSTIPYIAGILLAVITLWLFAVRRLGKLVAHSIDKPQEAASSPEMPDRVKSGVSAEAINA